MKKKALLIKDFPRKFWGFLTEGALPGRDAAMAAASAAEVSAPSSSDVSAVFPRVFRFFFGGLGLCKKKLIKAVNV